MSKMSDVAIDLHNDDGTVCPTCSGTGTMWDMAGLHSWTCHHCGGTGVWVGPDADADADDERFAEDLWDAALDRTGA